VKVNGKMIKMLRLRMDLSKNEFAKKYGMSRNTLARLENEIYDPNEKTIIKLSNIFKVNIETLLKGENDE